MNPTLQLLLRWALNAAALLLLPGLVSGLRVDDYVAALLAALLLGLVNALIRPILILVTLPITLLSLGFFTLVINALLFWAVSGLVSGVHVDDFWTAFWSALLYSLLTWLVNIATGERRGRITLSRNSRRDDL